MKIQFRRQTLELTDAQWHNLERIAQASGSLAPTGSNAGKPSWRTLMKRIADGDLKVSRRQPETVQEITITTEEPK